MYKKIVQMALGVEIEGTELLNQAIDISNKYKRALTEAALNAKDAYDPKSYRDVDKMASEIEKRRSETQKVLSEVEQKLGGIKVFPDAFEDLNRFTDEAIRQQNIVQKAFMSKIITKEDLDNIKTTYQGLDQSIATLETVLLEAATLQTKKKTLDPAAYDSQMAELRDKITEARNAVASKRKAYRQISEGVILQQQVQDKMAARKAEVGLAAYHETVAEVFPDTIKGIKEIFLNRDRSKGEGLLKQAKAKAKAVRLESTKAILNRSESDPMGPATKAMHKTAINLARVAGTFATAAQLVSGALSLLSGPFLFFKLLVAANDRVRELNKSLLGGRSLAELGVDLVPGDPEKSTSINTFFTELNRDFSSVLVNFNDKNPFKYSQEQLLEEINSLKPIYLPRATASLEAGKNAISEEMKFVNMNIALQRSWGMSTSALVDLEAELINEYGNSYDTVRSTMGQLELISKKSNLSVSRLLNISQSLADKSPVFGTQLVETASFFTKLYNSKLFTTKEATSYIEKLNSIFASPDTLDKAVGDLVANHRTEAADILKKGASTVDKNTDSGRRREQALTSAAALLKKGQQLTPSELGSLKEALSLLPAELKESVAALLLFGNKKVSDVAPDNKLPLSPELLGKAKALFGDVGEGVLHGLQSRIATVKDTNKTVYEALQTKAAESSRDGQRAINEVEQAQIKMADEFKPPFQEIKNFGTGMLNGLASLLESITGGLDKILSSSIMKHVSNWLSIGTDSGAFSQDKMNEATQAYSAIQAAKEALEKAAPGSAQREAKGKFDQAVKDFAKTAASREGRYFLQQQARVPLNFSNYAIYSEGKGLPETVLKGADDALQKDINQALFGNPQGVPELARQAAERSSHFATDIKNVEPLTPGQLDSFVSEAARPAQPLLGQQINIPRGGTTDHPLLTGPEVENLRALAKEESMNPKGLLLAGLTARFRGTPYFAFIMQEFGRLLGDAEVRKQADPKKQAAIIQQKLLDPHAQWFIKAQKSLKDANKDRDGQVTFLLNQESQNMSTALGRLRAKSLDEISAPAAPPAAPAAPPPAAGGSSGRPAPASPPTPRTPPAQQIGDIKYHVTQVEMIVHVNSIPIYQAAQGAIKQVLNEYAQQASKPS